METDDQARPSDRHTLLLTLTSNVVAAYLRGQHERTIMVDHLPELIGKVYGTFTSLRDPDQLDQAADTAGTKLSLVSDRKPAVSIKASVTPDHVACLECGFEGVMLRRHLQSEHDLTPEQYRHRWGLKQDHPIVAPEYSKRRSDLAKETGLGR